MPEDRSEARKLSALGGMMVMSEAARCVNTERPLTRPIDLTDRQDSMNATCSVEGCERPAFCTGVCDPHYRRRLRTGSLGGPEIHTQRKGITSVCKVADCDRVFKGIGCRGFCKMHYDRWLRHGDAGLAGPLKGSVPRQPSARQDVVGPANNNWRGDSVTYSAVHKRLVSLKGSASLQQCSHCANAAQEWAYDHQDADQRLNEKGQPYSTDSTHYFPLCTRCHRVFDREIGSRDPA